jgi:hypothetical protein
MGKGIVELPRFVLPLTVTTEDVALLCEVLDWAADRVIKKEKLVALRAEIEEAWWYATGAVLES